MRPPLCLLAALVCTACSASEDLLNVEPPKQKGTANSASQAGKDDYLQRQKDCWDMPSARACYEVGLNYELGLSDPRDLGKALEYYDKACEIDKQAEHCEAAERLRREAH